MVARPFYFEVYMNKTQFYPAKTKASSVTGALSVVNGGTDADNASDARSNLGVSIGTDVQAYDADLSAIAALSDTATGYLNKTAANTWNLSSPTVTLTGDVTGSGTLSSIDTTIASTGVTAGTYKSVTVNAKGQVTSGTNPTTLSGYGITDAVATTGAQTVAGVKTFSSNPVLSGGGITFPATQVASSNANTLDDYEEGTCTLTVTAATAPTGVTYLYNAARYVKIGSICHIAFSIKLSSAGSGGVGELRISGIPFVAAAVTLLYAAQPFLGDAFTTASTAKSPAFTVIPTNAALYGRLADNGDTVLPWSEVTAATGFYGLFTYITG